jgi:site-specific DNA recombinase
MDEATPRAVLYLRESVFDPDGIERHRRDCLRIAAERGWAIAAEYTDNGVSAYDRRKVRPNYNRMVADYQAGRFDALICWDLDRLYRQPRQLEDWIDLAEERGIRLVTANGEADLSTDNGRLFARIKASVARAEVERKSARQKLAAAQRADKGVPPLGVRLTGYTPKGELVEHEAAVVRELFERFHAGDTLKGLVDWLTEERVPTRHGGPWNPSSVRTILTNPRYAGRAIYQGEMTGQPGKWPPIIDEATYDAVNRQLADPRRRTQHGTARRYLGSGLFLCDTCDQPVRSHGSAAIGTRYRCAAGHFTRSAVPIDEFIVRVLRARLARPDLADLLVAPETDDARQVAAEITSLRTRLARTEADYDADLIDARRYKVKTGKLRAELATAEGAQARLLAGSGLAPLLTSPDPVAAFDAAPLGTKRAVLEFFMTVRLLPAPRGRKGFDPETVHVEWNNERAGTAPGNP